MDAANSNLTSALTSTCDNNDPTRGLQTLENGGGEMELHGRLVAVHLKDGPVGSLSRTRELRPTLRSVSLPAGKNASDETPHQVGAGAGGWKIEGLRVGRRAAAPPRLPAQRPHPVLHLLAGT